MTNARPVGSGHQPFRDTIDDLSGGVPYRHALFYHYPGGLRFKLSTGGDAFDQVLTALHKATAICEDIFDGEETLLVHLQKWAPSTRFALRRALRELDLAGITIPRKRATWLEKTLSDPRIERGKDEYWVNAAFELPASKLRNLLWCAVATDFARLHPNPYCKVYLVNPRSKLIVHPYDDRGIDIIGDKPALGELYRKHEAWLLDYDREAMDREHLPRPAESS